MYEIRSVLMSEKGAFSDMDALGVFIDNHDNGRFLSLTPSIPLFKAALSFALFAQGIPIIYYGSEQAFNGGNDPENREPLWTSMNTKSDLYKFMTTVIAVRKQHQVWSYPQVERWCDDSFFAFSRNDVLLAMTNDGNQGQQHREITYHPYKAGQKICNQLVSGDCVTISSDNKLSITLVNGEAKIYAPATSVEFLQE